ncbi:putative dinucleotide-binding enzyme [Arthrobacter ulcerisalmonis]|uniref:hypothetical protein n=1 Tax=Arthrobacter sp. B1I2 TaxID=3042263 RepID=UPI0027851FAF|nr:MULTISPECIES: hypothetical protein [Arthrobacter]MDQ0661636.1 putative dinucleotide-binding enzyme [Arthrobacter ulcerisalmonis]MDQ0729546.1 putative dinucleotide-binding enzyme [Arthrobacter sp. B1I2]
MPAGSAGLMVNPRRLAGGEHSVFVSGDDAEAKKVVTGLLESLGHRDIIDLGDITSARGAEMVMPLWLRLFGALGTRISTSRWSAGVEWVSGYPCRI